MTPVLQVYIQVEYLVYYIILVYETCNQEECVCVRDTLGYYRNSIKSTGIYLSMDVHKEIN